MAAREALRELLSRLEPATAKAREGAGDLRYVQLMVRMLVNVEALNMVESVGNVTRRRTVPVVVAEAPGKYVVRWVPAVSGETLAHRYQLEVVELARAHEGCRERIDYWSGREEFLKHWDLDFYRRQCELGNPELRPGDWECELAKKYADLKQGSVDQIADIERTIVSNSVVEDVAGFLVTQGPARRTSCVRFSYAIPTMDAVLVSQVDHQMHVRGALVAQSLRIRGYEEAIQIPYYVQVGSVVYGFNVELDLGCVGCYSIAGGCVQDDKCRLEDRRCIALYALRPVIDGDFGAKRSRYRPHNQLEVAIAVASSKPTPLPPATLPFEKMLEELKAKLDAYEKLGAEYKVYALVPRGLPYAKEAKEELVKRLGLKDEDVVSTVVELLEKLEGAVRLNCSTWRRS